MPDPHYESFIGLGIAHVRTARRKTQKWVAEECDLSCNFVSQVENGKKAVSHKVSVRIAEALKVPVSFLYLLGDQNDEPLVRDLREYVLRSLTLDPAPPKVQLDSAPHSEFVVN